MVGRNPANAGKGKRFDEQPFEQEILWPKTSIALLLAVEETLGGMNTCLVDLQLAIKRVSCQMELGTNALPHRQDAVARKKRRRRQPQLAGNLQEPRADEDTLECAKNLRMHLVTTSF